MKHKDEDLVLVYFFYSVRPIHCVFDTDWHWCDGLELDMKRVEDKGLDKIAKQQGSGNNGFIFKRAITKPCTKANIQTSHKCIAAVVLDDGTKNSIYLSSLE